MFAISFPVHASFSIARKVSTVVGGAALLALLTAASCEGDGFVRTFDLPQGSCILENPVTNPNPAAGSTGDVLQLADSSNVNDFIQCRLIASIQSSASVNVVIDVSPADAAGHSFVNTDRPAIIVNLSR